MKILYHGFAPQIWIGKCYGCNTVFEASDGDLRDVRAVCIGEDCKSDCPACGVWSIVSFHKKGSDEADKIIQAIPQPKDKPTPPPGRVLTETHN